MELNTARPLSITDHALPSAPYSLRPPSPPFIHIPVAQTLGEQVQVLMPSYESVDSGQLTSRDLDIITRNASQPATDRAAEWSYEQRREAQPLLDFLYLGPNSVARDHAFLQREGITMILVVRDARLAGTRLRSVDKAGEALGITIQYVDIQDTHQLTSMFPATNRLINNHMLAVYHNQAQGRDQDGQLIVEASDFRRGKVLITCETGNDRSSAVAAAYIMAVFGEDMTNTIQFICLQRFCCCFDEDVKRKLQAWGDILKARSQVAATARQSPERPALAPRSKRGIDDIQGPIGECYSLPTDISRFSDRRDFAPFLDRC